MFTDKRLPIRSKASQMKSDDKELIPINHIVGLLTSYRLRWGSEATLHESVEEVLLKNEVQFQREVILSSEDRIDFFLPRNGIGIECKVDGSKAVVSRQLVRYACSTQVSGLILITSKRSHIVDRSQLMNKPFHQIWIAGDL